jgi:hypothetical protein
VWFKNKTHFRKKGLAEVKDLARILVIDDRRPQLVDDLHREGWRVKYIPDLDSYHTTDLVDSHVICLDILGVGVALRCANGLELVKGIKGEYPEKKILLYSSVPTHNIFDDSIDLVDKRLFKDGQPYTFIKAVEELSFQSLDWIECARSVYSKFSSEFGSQLSFEDFEKKLRRTVSSSGTIDINKLAKVTVSAIGVAETIAKLLKAVLK